MGSASIAEPQSPASATSRPALPAKAALVANDDLQNRLSRTIPDNLSGLAWHIRGITALAIALKVVGAGIRLGGFN
jgi:hypothetical protein